MGFLDGKAAVVTGGTKGIGRGVAEALLAEGASVFLTARHAVQVQAAVGELGAAHGKRVAGAVGDVRHFDQVERNLQEAVDRFGGLDILINNAGVGAFSPIADLSLDDWHTVIDTNLTGVFYCCRAALPHLRRRGGGWIINVSSLAGKNPFVDGAAYCASKSGLNAFSEALMQEVRHDGIRVAYVLPGSVRTEFGGHSSEQADWKLAPEDVAAVVTDLVAHPSRSLPSRVELRPSRPPQKK